MLVVVHMLNPRAREFLQNTAWKSGACEPLTGDASVRKYYRLRLANRTAILMDASAIPQTIAPFVQIDQHLRALEFSAPEILVRDDDEGFLLLEDFGDDTFARLIDHQSELKPLFELATDVLIALHQCSGAILSGLRSYHREKMLADLELFLEWCTPEASPSAKAEFRSAWSQVLPLAHHVPASLLLRDYHAANLMWLPDRVGARRAGLLDFQDAYIGPVTYDLMSLLEDARRDVPVEIRQEMLARYLKAFPRLDPDACITSMTVLAALRHTRVLAIFERLSQFEKKHEYKTLYSPRVQALQQSAFRHPALAEVKRWVELHGR